MFANLLCGVHLARHPPKHARRLAIYNTSPPPSQADLTPKGMCGSPQLLRQHGDPYDSSSLEPLLHIPTTYNTPLCLFSIIDDRAEIDG